MADTETEVIKSGRRFIFTDPKDLAVQIKQYFDNQDPHTEPRLVKQGSNNKGEPMFGTEETLTEQKPYTVTGLARHLKVSRETLRNYRMAEHYSDEIPAETRQELIGTIEDAVQRVEEYNEAALHKSGISNGVKFNLVNNFRWIDKQVVETNTAEDDLDDLDDDPAAEIGDAAAKALEDDNASRTGSEDQHVDVPPAGGVTESPGDQPGSTPPE